VLLFYIEHESPRKQYQSVLPSSSGECVWVCRGRRDRDVPTEAGLGKCGTFLHIDSPLRVLQDGVVAQVVKLLHSKCKALSSNPSTVKKKQQSKMP
jgi:hypothetical protein